MKYMYCMVAFLVVMLGGCATTHYITVVENKVTFSLKNPAAKKMLFACSLDGYEEQQLKQENGLWQVTLPADKPFKYFFMADGEIFLPPCPLSENNDFGSKNCIFEPKL